MSAGSSLNLPDFLIIGAQKCGTSALGTNLRAHKAIAIPDGEMHFFNSPKNWAQGLEWYSSHFPKTDLVQGEKTPDYLDHFDAPGRIAQTLPHAKLIILIRDPVARAYSQWNQMMQTIERTAARGWELVSFAEAISRGFAGIDPFVRLLNKGRYIDHISRFTPNFPPRQIHIGIQERFFNNGSVELARVFEFLGVEALPVVPKKIHIRKYDSEMDPLLEKELIQFFAPVNQRLFEYLGEDIPEWRHA